METYGGHVYVLVRQDLSLAQQNVQSIHAVLCASMSDLIGSIHPHLVLGKVKDEPELLKWADKLDAKGVKFSMFREPDIGNQATALATEPLYNGKRSILKNVKLVGA